MARLLRFAAAVACLAVAVTQPAGAQDYPNKPVRIVVGFIPGSAANPVTLQHGETGDD